MQQSSNTLRALFWGFWILVLGLMLGGALGALVSQRMTPIYQATVYLLVVPESANAATSTANDYAQAYSNLATDPAVIGEAVEESEVGVDPWDIERFVRVEVSPNVPLFQITTSFTDPEDASTLANALASGLSSFVEEREEDTGYRVDVIAEAVPPEEPALPNWFVNIAVGAAAGLLVGGVMALLWDNLRQARKASADRRRAKQEEEERQRLEEEMAELEKSAERYSRLEQDKQRLEREMAELETSARRYGELEQDKQRLEREMAELDRQRREGEMAELEQIVKRYFRLEEDKQRLEREMAEFEKPAIRYFGLERDKQRLEREMAGLERSARRYVELRSSDLHGLRQGKSSRDGADNSLLAKLPDEPQKRG